MDARRRSEGEPAIEFELEEAPPGDLGVILPRRPRRVQQEFGGRTRMKNRRVKANRDEWD